MTGIELLRKMRLFEPLKDSPVVFLTTSKDPDLKERATAVGAQFVFQKPFSIDGWQPILDSIRQIITPT